MGAGREAAWFQNDNFVTSVNKVKRMLSLNCQSGRLSVRYIMRPGNSFKSFAGALAGSSHQSIPLVLNHM